MTDSSGDPTSIGSILLQMGVVTPDQLVQAVEDQRKLQVDALLGKILVANGFCTAGQLEVAMAAQKSMRTGDEGDRAMAVADLAIARRRRKSIIATRDRIIQKGERVVRTITGEDHPAITPEMLAKSGE